jgi:selenocysteine-specific elongation factor
MRVIGTAGHVDHGKSTLVQALTGIHPDRLKEEREREMTIDLGFAWMTLPKSDLLPDGEEIGIVDVPGHRDFIENMLSGVGGIDAALFVIAADEGIMPQTREHLAILDILQIPGGVVALTKIDLVDDPEWLDLIEEDIRKALAGTVLAGAPIGRVSARTGQGLPELLYLLSGCIADKPSRADTGRPRLPVDRVFTMPGFGTVVTGTLTDGSLYVGDEVEVLGSAQEGLRGRVRGLQTHKHKVQSALPGSRTAVNISGIDLAQIERGSVVAHPGDFRVSGRLDVRFRLLPDCSQPLAHNVEVKLFLGTAERVARVRLLGVEELLPGQETWLQLECADPVVAVRGDHYILRRPSPGETLGGGVVIDPHPKSRYKRFSLEVLERLENLTQGTPAEVLQQAILALGAATFQEIVARSSLDAAAARSALEELVAQDQVLALEVGTAGSGNLQHAMVAAKGYWQRLAARAVQEVSDYHRNNPLRRGMAREELKSRMKLQPRLFAALVNDLGAKGEVLESGPWVQIPGHQIRFTETQRRQVDGLLAKFKSAPYSPPTIKECQAEVGEEVYNALVDLGELYAVHPEVVFRRQDYDQMVGELRRLLASQTTVTAAEVRDHFKTSRRYVLAFLEHLDASGITVREGDARRLRR